MRVLDGRRFAFIWSGAESSAREVLMTIRVLCAAALLLGIVSTAHAQMLDDGTVLRLDPQSSVVMLQDGRMYRVTPNTVVLIDNRPTTFTALRSGDRVIIQNGEPVAYRDGRYTTITAAPAIVNSPTVAQVPVPTVAVPAGVRQTVYGTVTDVDRNGEIKIKTAKDSFEVRLAPEATRQVRKGDNVVIDLTISAPGAASPR
jgi:hypothetical protein